MIGVSVMIGLAFGLGTFSLLTALELGKRVDKLEADRLKKEGSDG